jgi:hypothetical protein
MAVEKYTVRIEGVQIRTGEEGGRRLRRSSL